MKTETKKRKTARKQAARRRKSEERKRFYLENYGVSWKGATPEVRYVRSERAKRQDLTLFRRAQKEKVAPPVRYFVNDRPYYEYSDPVGWNRDAARYFIAKIEKIGFLKVKEVLSWKWANRHTAYNRLRCRANMEDRKLSEKEHAKELGLFKIYDAGQRLYEKRTEKEQA